MAVCFPDNAIWPDPTVLPPEPEDPDNLTPTEIEAALEVEIALTFAWTTLQTLSAYQIAICPITVRPCKESCSPGSYFVAPVVGGPAGAPFWPSVTNGVWTNVWCGHSRADCSCTRVRELTLPGPVGGIVEVKIGTEVLDPTEYRVDNSNLLVRMGGEDWPACQDMNLPLGVDNTFSVTYYQGATADSSVRYAAGILADEFLKDMHDEDCRLPAGTSNIVRQGLTIEVQTDLFTNGITGIRTVDAVIARYNPFHAKLPATFYSPDAPKARRTTIGG